jgi:hypothetical protein
MSKHMRQMQQQSFQQAQRTPQYYRRLNEAQVQQQFRRNSQAFSQGGDLTLVTTPSPTIFISYRRHDSGQIAQQIQTPLKGRFPHDRIFCDVASIDAGADFKAAIEKAIVESNLVLVIFGPNWLVGTDGQSVRDNPEDYARFEIEIANRHKKPIVPLLVNGAVMPSAAELPRSVASFFPQLNASTVRPGDAFYTDMDALARVKEQYAPSPPPSSATNPGFEAFGGVRLVISIFFALFSLFPIVPYFMARSQLKGNSSLTGTGRALLRASMVISAVALVVQGLAMCAIVVTLIIGAQAFISR